MRVPHFLGSLLGQGSPVSNLPRRQEKKTMTWSLLLTCALCSLLAAEVHGHPSGELAAELQIALEHLDDAQIAFFPGRGEFPARRELSHPGALLMAVNFGRLSLLPGDVLTVGGLRGSDAIVVTSATNQSVATEATTQARVWDYPFVVTGDTVAIEYRPSLTTLMLPPELVRHLDPVAVVNSYVYALSLSGDIASGSASSNSTAVVSESIIGNQSELHEAVCFKKCAPQMYAKANAVARLLIRKYAEDPPCRWGRASGSIRPPTNAWSFCTGWVLGRGNYIVTNYHCVGDALKKYGGSNAWGSHGWANNNSNVSAANASDEYAMADVNFRAETKTCADRGYKGEKSGVVEATRVSVVAANKSLDYALLLVKRNRSDADLSATYGFLTVRASGPVDGEPIYIPQHPNGEPKEIAAVKNGKPAVILVSGTNASSWPPTGSPTGSQGASPDVWYNADTQPGSSGSPVISQRDNTVVALHHAGSWGYGNGGDDGSIERNYGVRMDVIARDMEAHGVLPPCAVARPCPSSSTDACCSSQRRL